MKEKKKKFHISHRFSNSLKEEKKQKQKIKNKRVFMCIYKFTYKH